MIIRPYQEQDLCEVMQVYLLAKRDELSAESAEIKIVPFTDNPSALALFEQSSIYVCVDDDGMVLGFAGHQASHIIWLYVHPEQRGKAVAYRLIKYIESLLSGEIYLTLLKSNTVARRFYERLGFEVSDELQGVHQGITLYALKMTKQLLN